MVTATKGTTALDRVAIALGEGSDIIVVDMLHTTVAGVAHQIGEWSSSAECKIQYGLVGCIYLTHSGYISFD